jgi:hypothetical protein
LLIGIQRFLKVSAFLTVLPKEIQMGNPVDRPIWEQQTVVVEQ